MSLWKNISDSEVNAWIKEDCIGDEPRLILVQDTRDTGDWMLISKAGKMLARYEDLGTALKVDHVLYKENTTNCRCPGWMTSNCRHVNEGHCPRADNYIPPIQEDAPTNAVGSGNMSGGGNMAGYSPLLFKHKKFKRARKKLRKFGDIR